MYNKRWTNLTKRETFRCCARAGCTFTFPSVKRFWRNQQRCSRISPTAAGLGSVYQQLHPFTAAARSIIIYCYCYCCYYYYHYYTKMQGRNFTWGDSVADLNWKWHESVFVQIQSTMYGVCTLKRTETFWNPRHLVPGAFLFQIVAAIYVYMDYLSPFWL